MYYNTYRKKETNREIDEAGLTIIALLGLARLLTLLYSTLLPARMPHLPRDARIVIVGGGIGGLAVGIALKRQGFARVQVFERAVEIRPVGAGLR